MHRTPFVLILLVSTAAILAAMAPKAKTETPASPGPCHKSYHRGRLSH